MQGKPGWKWLYNATKWHYFAQNGHSLCGKWMTLTLDGTETGDDDSTDNCAACRKKLTKEVAAK